MEGVKEINTCTLANLGLGTTSGIAIGDCTSGKEKAVARKEVVTALLALDKGLPRRLSDAPKAVDRKAEAAVQVNQMIAATVRLATSAPPPKKEGPAYILTQSEEERNYSVQSLDTTEMKELCKTVAAMQNIRLRGHELGTVSNLKKVMYWTKIEGTTPDPDRVPLKGFRRTDEDSWCLAFKRAIYSVAVCAAGVEARPELRDDGAGLVKKFGVQWCNAMVAEDLVKEFEEHAVRSKLTQGEMKAVAELIWLTLHKSTGTHGNETASLAMAQMVSRVPELAASYANRSQKHGERTPPKGDKEKEKQKPPKGTPAGKEKNGKRKRVERPAGGWKDEAGAMYANGLKRMVGGNPKGDKCKYIEDGKDCPFKTCAFSHE